LSVISYQLSVEAKKAKIYHEANEEHEVVFFVVQASSLQFGLSRLEACTTIYFSFSRSFAFFVVAVFCCFCFY